jgi:hypothetical protein
MKEIYDNEELKRREILKDGVVISWYSKTLIENEISKGRDTKPFDTYPVKTQIDE